jgi:hypothetical protein
MIVFTEAAAPEPAETAGPVDLAIAALVEAAAASDEEFTPGLLAALVEESAAVMNEGFARWITKGLAIDHGLVAELESKAEAGFPTHERKAKELRLIARDIQNVSARIRTLEHGLEHSKAVLAQLEDERSGHVVAGVLHAIFTKPRPEQKSRYDMSHSERMAHDAAEHAERMRRHAMSFSERDREDEAERRAAAAARNPMDVYKEKVSRAKGEISYAERQIPAYKEYLGKLKGAQAKLQAAQVDAG